MTVYCPSDCLCFLDQKNRTPGWHRSLVRVLGGLFSLYWCSWGVDRDSGIEILRVSFGSLRALRLLQGALESLMLFCGIHSNCLQDCLVFDLQSSWLLFPLCFLETSLKVLILLGGSWRGPFPSSCCAVTQRKWRWTVLWDTIWELLFDDNAL